MVDGSIKDREFNKFVDSEKRAGFSAVEVIIGNGSANPVPVSISPAESARITNLSLPVANNEVAHSLVASLKQLIIRSRNKKKIQFSFVVSESGTKFITLEAGATLALEGLLFTGESLYLQSPNITTVEILEIS